MTYWVQKSNHHRYQIKFQKIKLKWKFVKHFGSYEIAIFTMTWLSIILKCVQNYCDFDKLLEISVEVEFRCRCPASFHFLIFSSYDWTETSLRRSCDLSKKTLNQSCHWQKKYPSSIGIVICDRWVSRNRQQ